MFGGRWNSEGRAVIYSSETLSLAALEYLVHVDPRDVPSDLIALEVDLPDGGDLGAVADAARFSDPNWRATPAPDWQAGLGDEWLADGSFLWLAVPSAVVPEERNVLINPRHPMFRRVRIRSERPFAFDLRLLE